MTRTVTVRTTIDLVDFTPQLLAMALAELTDDDIAQVIIELARIASTWAHQPDQMWHAIGRHLRDCECSTEEAREFVRLVAAGMEP